MSDRFYPMEESLGKECVFWQGRERNKGRELAHYTIGCAFAKLEMEGRLSCEGMIDNVCIYLMYKRRLPSLSEEKVEQIRQIIPGGDTRDLPPGDIY